MPSAMPRAIVKLPTWDLLVFLTFPSPWCPGDQRTNKDRTEGQTSPSIRLSTYMAHITQLSEHLAASHVSVPATPPPNPTDTPQFPPTFPPPHRDTLSFLIGTILLPGRNGSTRLLRDSWGQTDLDSTWSAVSSSGEEEGEGRRSKGRVKGYYH